MRKAGRELDAEVAVAIFGYEWVGNPRGIQNLTPKFGGREVTTRRGKNVDYFGSDENPYLPRYSTDIAAAWQVVDRMRTNPFGIGSDFELLWGPEPCKEDEWVAVFGSRLLPGNRIVEASASTAPLAICLAAIAAVGVVS